MYNFPSIKLMVFSPRTQRLQFVFKRYSHLFDDIITLNKTGSRILTNSILTKKEFEEILNKHVGKFAIFEIEKESLDNILDKMLNKEKITLSDRKRLYELSI